jgi:hypothetical protein
VTRREPEMRVPISFMQKYASRIGPAPMLVYQFILIHFNRRKCLAWPSVRRLSADTGLPRRTVQLCLRTLETTQLIETVRMLGKPSQFRLARGAQDMRGGAQDMRRGCAGGAHPYEPTLMNLHQEPPPQTPPRAGGLETDDGFAAFWNAYPRHTALEHTRAAWRKLAPDPILVQMILCALAWQVKLPEWQREGGRFIPHPAAWLAGKRWADEPPRRPAGPESAAEYRARMNRGEYHRPAVNGNGKH